MDIHNLVRPETTVLIVIDKQGGYFDPEMVKGRGKELPVNSMDTLDSIDNFILKSRTAKVEVIWTQMVENVDESPENITSKMRTGSFQRITKLGEVDFEIYGSVKPIKGEKVIYKYRYDAFAQTDLAEYLKSKKIKTVVLVGGYGSRCVLSTAFGANGHDLTCVIPKGLLVNQAGDTDEIESAYSIVDAILGYVVEVDDIHTAWSFDTPS